MTDGPSSGRERVNAGHTLTLVFSTVRDGKQMAVIQTSPDVRNAIACSDNCVFLGLTSCRAFDRFWATQVSSLSEVWSHHG